MYSLQKWRHKAPIVWYATTELSKAPATEERNSLPYKGCHLSNIDKGLTQHVCLQASLTLNIIVK